MDPRILEAISMNDLGKFLELIRENEGNLDHKTSDCLNTVLHFATKFGHIDIVREIIKLRPDMVAAENKDSETPVFEACRRANPDILKLLLEANPKAAFWLNSDKQSPFFVACSFGHLDAVNLLLKQPEILDFEQVGPDRKSCIHEATSRGHTGLYNLIELY